MTSEELIKSLKEFTKNKDVEELNGEERKLFNAIMKIADERNEQIKLNEEHQKINGELREIIKKILEYAKFNIFSDDYEIIKKISRGEDW